MATSPAANVASSGRHDRHTDVESALAALVRRPAVRRAPPPEGRLGADDYPTELLRLALSGLGPVFASFGRYLSARPDLLPRRDCAELAGIADAGRAAEPAAVDALVHRQLGALPSRRYFQFDPRAHHVTLWTERHDAWVAPGVPAVVTIVRPDATAWLEDDLPLLALLQGCFPVAPDTFAAAVEDFSRTLRMRLDQTAQAAALVTLTSDATTVLGFTAPTCYRDYCAAGVLTLERCEGQTLAEVVAEAAPGGDRPALARRIASAWLRQAFAGRIVPFEIAPGDVVVEPERLILTGGGFEPHSSAERTRFSRYLNAVSADDPDAAAAWIVDAAGVPAPAAALEEDLKRRFRQAVPFRDGEWSGDDRLAEFVLVQWRVAREAGWRLTPHHLRVYRGIESIRRMAERLAPDEDALLGALEDERLRIGRSEAIHLLDPRVIGQRLDSALQEIVGLPQRLDEVLTLASEGRLRVKLQIPESGGTRHVRHQTILLVANLVLLTAVASLVRHVSPAYGPALERLGVVALLVVGGWLLVAAARL